MIKQSKNRNQLLIAPMTIYSATVLCFIMSDITRHVITPCMGVGAVPFLMITYGIGIRYSNAYIFGVIWNYLLEVIRGQNEHDNLK